MNDKGLISKTPILGWLKELSLTLIFISIALVIYFPILTAFFQGDDFDLLWLIHQNGPFGVWTQHSNFFRPLISLSLYLNQQTSGLSSTSFHLTNVCVHGISAFFVYQAGRLLFGKRELALWAGAFFLVLPVHAEAVSWISGRTDVFAGAGALAAFWCYLKYAQIGNVRWLIAGELLFCLALLCKEAVVTLPLIILVYEWFAQSEAMRRRFASLLFVGTVVIYIVARRLLLGVWIGGYSSSLHLKPDPITILRGLILYPFRSFYPHVPGEYLPASGLLRSIGLTIHTGEPTITSALLFLAIAGISIWSIFYFLKGCWTVYRNPSNTSIRTRQIMIFFIAGFGIALLPVLSMGTAISLTDSEGGRLLYFPSAFSVLLTVGFISQVSQRRQRAVFAAILAIYSLALFHTNQTWHRAADVTQQILKQSLDQANRQPIVLINVPDNLAGAYVFRNGLGPAWHLFGGIGQPPITLTSHTIQSPADLVEVSMQRNLITINLHEPNYFRPVSPTPTAKLAFQKLVVTQPSPLQSVIERAPLPQSPPLFFFSAGRIQELTGF